MSELNVKIKKLTQDATIPTKGSEEAAGRDLYACVNAATVINPHMTKKISTGIALEIPKGYFGAVFARSGLSTKKSLAPITAVSVIDSDYRGEVFVPIHNHSNTAQFINPQERIAQLIILPCPNFEFEEVDELDETERGGGGFGSTGGF